MDTKFKSLNTAWLLRQFILPEVTDLSDRVSMAVSLPFAFAKPVISFMEPKTRQIALWDSFFLSLPNCSSTTIQRYLQYPFKPAMIISTKNEFEQVACWATRWVLDGLSHKNAGLVRNDITPLMSWLSVTHKYLSPKQVFTRACQYNLCNLVRLLHESCQDKNRYNLAVLTACRYAHESVLGLLSEPQYSIYWGFNSTQRIRVNAFTQAIKGGNPAIIDMLLKHPYNIKQSLNIRHFLYGLKLACKYNHVNIVTRLSYPPFNLQKEDAILSNVFVSACAKGYTTIIKRLTQPPFSLGRESAIVSNAKALTVACSNGFTDVVHLLSQPPFNLGQDEARLQDGWPLRSACLHGHAEIVKRLSQPPYSLNHQDGACLDNSPLRLACEYGHVSVIKVLRGAPYSLTAVDARVFSNSALRLACAHGHCGVIRVLQEPPFDIGYNDVREADNSALYQACIHNRINVIEMLGAPPFNMGNQEVLHLQDVLKQRKAYIPESINALKKPPYLLRI